MFFTYTYRKKPARRKHTKDCLNECHWTLHVNILASITTFFFAFDSPYSSLKNCFPMICNSAIRRLACAFFQCTPTIQASSGYLRSPHGMWGIFAALARWKHSERSKEGQVTAESNSNSSPYRFRIKIISEWGACVQVKCAITNMKQFLTKETAYIAVLTRK